MCGIIWCDSNDKDVSGKVAEKYEDQKTRGRQGFAFLPVYGGSVGSVVRKMDEEGILEGLKNTVSRKILFHHRLPTSTVNIPCATHPIVVKNDLLMFDYYIVHNGVIQNPDELRKSHEEMGFVYNTVIKKTTAHVGVDNVRYISEEKESFNDSESLAIELALFIEGKSEKIKTRGSVAFICLQASKDGKARQLFFGRNGGNPLVISKEDGVLTIRSEGKGDIVPVDMIHYYKIGDENFEIKSYKAEIGDYFRHVYTPRARQTMGFGAHQTNLSKKQQKRLRKSNFKKGADGKWYPPDKLDDDFELPDSSTYFSEKLADPSYTVTDYINDLWQEVGDIEEEIAIVNNEIDAVKQDIDNFEDVGLNTDKLWEQLSELMQQREDLKKRLDKVESEIYNVEGVDMPAKD